MVSSAAHSKRSTAIGIRDVAAAAAVSVGTVSNVLNRPDQVAAPTRLRVTTVMDELGFVPSRAAGQLRSRRSELIGVVVPDVGNPFWAAVLRGIEKVLDTQDMTMLVNSTRQIPERQRSALRALRRQGVDGLIIAPIGTDNDDLSQFLDVRLGVVTLGVTRAEQNLPSVNTDSVLGGWLAMTHLLAQGHSRVGLINGPDFVSWCEMRRSGAVAAIREAGIDACAALSEVTVADLTVPEGERAAGELLDNTDVTAILCANDLLALGAIREIHIRGLAVPDDVSVIGYDDADFAAALAPPLTTVYQPSHRMGEAAAELLFHQSNKEGGVHIEFEPALVSRSSVSAPRSQRFS